MKMKEIHTIPGKSLLLNISFVCLNLAGVVLMVLGFHDNFEEKAFLFRVLGTILLLLSTAGLIVFRGRLLMSGVARVLVGGLFIVSGLVKANDPVGFSYKLEEYFEDGALAFRIKSWFSAPEFSLEFFMDYALMLSVLICIAEIVLGVLTILGGKIKLVSYAMLLMMLFFTFLTWHTASCDSFQKFTDRDTYAMSDPIAVLKRAEAEVNTELTIVSEASSVLVVDELKMPQCVDDCGCFGDAMKGSVGRSLTPKESLWKDIVLVYLVGWIFVTQFIIKRNTRKENRVFITASMLVILFFSWVFGWYFPVFFGLASVFGSLWFLNAGGRYLGNYYGSTLFVSGLCGVLVWYVLSYLPLKDYRAYAVGSNLIEKMNDGVEGEYESLLVYKNKKTGKTVEFLASSTKYRSSKIWEDKDWVYDSMIQKEITPTRIPSITNQFNPFIGTDEVGAYELKLDSVALKMDAPSITEISIRDYVINAEKIVLLSSKSLDGANWGNLKKIKAIQKACALKSVPFVMICSASRERINAFRKKYSFTAPIFVNDETELKAISRSNPTILVIENAVVVGKYPYRSTPSKEGFITKHLD